MRGIRGHHPQSRRASVERQRHGIHFRTGQQGFGQKVQCLHRRLARIAGTRHLGIRIYADERRGTRTERTAYLRPQGVQDSPGRTGFRTRRNPAHHPQPLTPDSSGRRCRHIVRRGVELYHRYAIRRLVCPVVRRQPVGQRTGRFRCRRSAQHFRTERVEHIRYLHTPPLLHRQPFAGTNQRLATLALPRRRLRSLP